MELRSGLVVLVALFWACSDSIRIDVPPTEGAATMLVAWLVKDGFELHAHDLSEPVAISFPLEEEEKKVFALLYHETLQQLHLSAGRIRRASEGERSRRLPVPQKMFVADVDHLTWKSTPVEGPLLQIQIPAAPSPCAAFEYEDITDRLATYPMFGVKIDTDRTLIGRPFGRLYLISEAETVPIDPRGTEPVTALYLDAADRIWLGGYGWLQRGRIANDEIVGLELVHSYASTSSVAQIVGGIEESREAIYALFWDGRIERIENGVSTLWTSVELSASPDTDMIWAGPGELFVLSRDEQHRDTHKSSSEPHQLVQHHQYRRDGGDRRDG